MEIKSEYRLGGKIRRDKSYAGYIFVAFMLIASGLVFYLQTFGSRHLRSDEQNQQVLKLIETMKRLNIETKEIILKKEILEPLIVLQKEKCDVVAIRTLGNNLRKASYRREAANAYSAFADTCPFTAFAWRASASIYLTDLLDFKNAIDAATKAIDAEPFIPQPYYIRGVASLRSDNALSAIDDLSTYIQLMPDPSRLNSLAFVRLSESYDRSGDVCNGIVPLLHWVSINPAKNDTPQMREMIKSLFDKGDCPVSKQKAEDVFFRQKDVMVIQTSVNGVRGKFLLDTGASFVTMKKSFASKANVTIFSNSSVRLNTANGVSTAMRGVAKRVQLIKIAAENVPVLVQDDAAGAYGPDVDGLLGISFLANFDLNFDGQAVKISTRSITK